MTTTNKFKLKHQASDRNSVTYGAIQSKAFDNWVADVIEGMKRMHIDQAYRAEITTAMSPAMATRDPDL